MDAHRPAWTLGRRGGPPELSAERAWRWCVLRTLRDAKQAKSKGRPIATHHLARLFARRWHQMSDQLGEFDRNKYLRTLRLGRYLLGKVKRD
jgi:predicted transcriptional regulator